MLIGLCLCRFMCLIIPFRQLLFGISRQQSGNFLLVSVELSTYDVHCHDSMDAFYTRFNRVTKWLIGQVIVGVSD